MKTFCKILFTLFIGLPLIIFLRVFEFVHFDIMFKLLRKVQQAELWAINKIQDKDYA